MLSETRPAKVGTWTEPALRVLRERYLLRDERGEVTETPEEMCWRVAQSIAAGEARYGRSPAAVREVAEAFYDMMVDALFVPNSPTLMNAGKGNGLQYSACYVLPVGDSMGEIFDSVKAAAIIHQSGGGCIAGDARVWTTFCGLEPIEVLVNRATADGRAGERDGAAVRYDVTDLDIRTASMDPATGKTGLRRVTHVWRFDVPAEQQLVVQTREGTRVQTSAWHPFMVLRAQGLTAVRADAVAPGDVILGPERPDGYWPYDSPRRAGQLEIDESLGWLVGFTLGDGSFGYVPALRQYRLRWFSGERDVLERVRSILARQGIHVSIQRDRRGLWSVSTLTQRFVMDMLEACGLEKIGPKDDRVRVPEVIAKSPLAVVRAFLAGLVDSDGYVAPDGSPSYSTASREMAEDLAGLVSLLGYQPSVCAKPPRGRGKHTVYSVQLCTLPQVNALRADLVPFAASEHRITRLHSASRKQTALRLPFRPWRDRLKALGLVSVRGRKGRKGPVAAELNRWSCNVGGRCRRDDLARIAGLVRSRDAHLGALLDRVATRGMEVAAVTRARQPKAYYDLTVEDWNTYAAGTHGLTMVHNTGFAFSRLRPKDDVVSSTRGRASGPVSFLRVFNAATEAVKQGGTRRGANMGILRVDHPDILEFIDCKLDGGITNFNISVAVTDTFMEALARGSEYDLVNPRTRGVVGQLSAHEVFERVVRAAWRTGDPGMVFIDRINASPANPTPEIGVVEATNPCVTGDTLIYTARGPVRADTLAAARESTDVVLDSRFDAGEWGPASTVFETGVRPVYRLTTEEGYEVRLTGDHRVMTARGWRRADELRPGDLIHIVNRKGGFGEAGSLEEGRILGWLVGDGHIRPDKGVILRFYGEEKRELAPAFAGYMNKVVGSSAGDRYHIAPVEITGRDQSTVSSVRVAKHIFERFGVTQDNKVSGVREQILSGSEILQRGFLQALFTADGQVCGSRHTGLSVRLTSISLPLLKDVQRMLLNFGIASRVYANRHPARRQPMPDGQGGTASYDCQPDHDLAIARENLVGFLDDIGFLTQAKQDRLQAAMAYVRRPYREPFLARFEALEPAGAETVFDLKEPLTHSFIANGLVVHNCGEQPLLPNEACNLGSLNVSKFARQGEDGEWTVDWDEMERVVRLGVRFLDDVIEMNPYPLPEIDQTVKANRRIGLGIMGWADLLFIMGIPYDSQEAIDLADRLMAFVKERSHDQCAKLAEERGPFPNWSRSIYRDTRPMRNSTVTTIAPTGTISMIAGCSSGIEPIFALAFQHRVKQPDGERVLTFVNETFEKIAKARGFYSDALMEEIVKRGALHGIPGLPEEASQVFKTSHEIGFEWHVRHQAAFQRSTDNGVSKTINLPNDASEEDVASAYRLAWELGCLGITVFRDGCKGEQVLHVGIKDKAPAPSAGPSVVKPRPHSLSGRTYRAETPIGTAFITVNETQDLEPFEVFVQVGKGGSDTMAVAEALGRLISLTLRLPSPMSPQRRLEEVISQLSRIGGAQPLGFGKGKVLSLPDALARTLAEHTGQLKHASEAPPMAKAGDSRRIGDLCKECGQATFVYEEGCKKCLSCGYNEC